MDAQLIFVGHVSSAADVPVSPVSESQNRLLSNDQHANNIGDHQANNTLKSGELNWGAIIFHQQN